MKNWVQAHVDSKVKDGITKRVWDWSSTSLLGMGKCSKCSRWVREIAWLLAITKPCASDGCDGVGSGGGFSEEKCQPESCQPKSPRSCCRRLFEVQLPGKYHSQDHQVPGETDIDRLSTARKLSKIGHEVPEKPRNRSSSPSHRGGVLFKPRKLPTSIMQAHPSVNPNISCHPSRLGPFSTRTHPINQSHL